MSFRLLIGGGGCETANTNEDVVLEYGTPSSSIFTRLQLFPYYSQSHQQAVILQVDNNVVFIGYQTSYFQTVVVTLTAASKMLSTVLRWRQLTHSGTGMDEWAIDHIQIVGTQEIQPLPPLLAEDFYPIPTFPYVQKSFLVRWCLL